MIKRGGMLMAAVVAISLAAGCSTSKLICPAVAYFSGIGIREAPGLIPANANVRVSACIGSDCTSLPQLKTFEEVAALSRVDGSAPLLVTVQITDVDTSCLWFAGSTTVRPRKFEPNPGCNPAIWIAHVTAAADGTLQPS